MYRTLETPARPLWAYMYSMSFIDYRKGHHSGYLGIAYIVMSFTTVAALYDQKIPLF